MSIRAARTELGKPARFVPSTRVHTGPGGNQSYNLFSSSSQAKADEANVLSPKNSLNVQQSTFAPDNVQKPKTTTRVHAVPGGKSNMSNLLKDQENEENVPRSSTRVHAAPGGADNMSSLLSQAELPQQARSTTRLHAAPGGKDSMAGLFAPPNEDDVRVRSSTRLHAAPGGTDHMSGLLTASADGPVDVPAVKYPQKYQDNNIFAAESDSRPRSSSRVLAPPGGSSQSKMSAIISHQLPVEPVRTFMTSKTNMSHDAVIPSGSHSLPPSPTRDFKLRSYKTNESRIAFGDEQSSHSLPPSPTKDFKLRSYKTNESHISFGQPLASSSLPPSPTKDFKLRSYKTNESSNVINLTPKAAASGSRKGSRTYRTNECSAENSAMVDMESQAAKHSVHNQMMAGNNIFADDEVFGAKRKGRTSVRLHHAPGGNSNISWQ